MAVIVFVIIKYDLNWMINPCPSAPSFVLVLCCKPVTSPEPQEPPAQS